jgi:aspartyl/asparaginyl-tRNA synthetase
MGGPMCRADVYTGRHPAEYWMIEPEIRRVEQWPLIRRFSDRAGQYV